MRKLSLMLLTVLALSVNTYAALNAVEVIISPGNSVSLSVNGKFLRLNMSSGIVVYDASSRVIQLGSASVSYDASDRIVQVGSFAISYDASDRITKIGNTAVAYDASDRMVQIGNATVAYDAFGRIIKISGDINGPLRIAVVP